VGRFLINEKFLKKLVRNRGRKRPLGDLGVNGVNVKNNL
jgi:hypothetical protein